MHRMLPTAAFVALLTALLALAGQSALVATLVSSVNRSVEAEPPPLHVTVDVPDLWPGHHTMMAVRVTSTAATGALKITALQARVSAAAPGCGAADVAVTDYGLSAGGPTYVVQPGATVTVPVAITMLNRDTNQDACKGATFPIDVRAQSVPVA